MPKDKILCEYEYRTGRLCNCGVDFMVTALDIRRATKPHGLCSLHLGFYLVRHNNLNHTVKRIVPREERA